MRKGVILIWVLVVFTLALFIFGTIVSSTTSLSKLTSQRMDATNIRYELESNLYETVVTKDTISKISSFLYNRSDLGVNSFVLMDNFINIQDEPLPIKLFFNKTNPINSVIMEIICKKSDVDFSKSSYGYYHIVNPDFVSSGGIIDKFNFPPGYDTVDEFIYDCVGNQKEWVSSFTPKPDIDYKDAERIEISRTSHNSNSMKIYNSLTSYPSVRNISKSEVTINAVDSDHKKTDIVFKDESTLAYNMAIRGLIITDGNLIIEDNCSFSGIVVLTGGDIIIEGDKTLKLSGLVISSNIVNKSSGLNINYSFFSNLKYGPMLPNFIKLKLLGLNTI